MQLFGFENPALPAIIHVAPRPIFDIDGEDEALARLLGFKPRLSTHSQRKPLPSHLKGKKLPYKRRSPITYGNGKLRAARVIEDFGGIKKLQKALERIGSYRSIPTLTRWKLSKSVGGTGGVVPKSAGYEVFVAAVLAGIQTKCWPAEVKEPFKPLVVRKTRPKKGFGGRNAGRRKVIET